MITAAVKAVRSSPSTQQKHVSVPILGSLHQRARDNMQADRSIGKGEYRMLHISGVRVHIGPPSVGFTHLEENSQRKYKMISNHYSNETFKIKLYVRVSQPFLCPTFNISKIFMRPIHNF